LIKVVVAAGVVYRVVAPVVVSLNRSL